MNNRLRLSQLTLFSLLMACSPALAHNLWLNPGDFYPPVGATVDIGIGWGHQFPASRIDQEVTEGRVAAILALDPDGETVSLTRVSPALYRLAVEKPGAYRVFARIAPGFFTTTPQGRQWGNKETVADPIKCTHFHILAQTVILAGGSGTNRDAATGRALELVLLDDPRGLKAGEKVSVQVLFDGKPLPGTAVKATYAGFEAEATAGPGAGGKGHAAGGRHYPVETVTDGEGKAALPLVRAGHWMVLLSHRPPYPDRDTCDEYMYNTAFTLEVQP